MAHRRAVDVGIAGSGLAALLRAAAAAAGRVRAETAADIYGALQVARRFKLKLVVEGGTEAWKMAEELGAAAASVVLASGTDPTGKLPPPKPFRAPAGRGHAEAAAILKKAGVRLALVPKKDGAFEDLLWYAATARVPGKFSDEDVLRAVTSDAAKVLGVDALAGTLRVGGAADIVGFDHHPLQAAARPVLVVSAGNSIPEATLPLNLNLFVPASIFVEKLVKFIS